MIRGLTDSEMEDASGGFSFESLSGLTNGLQNNIESAHEVPNLPLQISQAVSLPPLVGMASPEPQSRATNIPLVATHFPSMEDTARPVCLNRRGRYAICTQDGMNERWESYRPKQPSFRSRFINR